MTDREEPTEDIIRREIKEARRIIREDRLITSHAELRDRFDKQFPPEPEVPEGTPPPPKPKATDGDPASRKAGLWWGKQG